jgi:hypothetical protein
MFYLVLLVANNKNLFKMNLEIHNIGTRSNTNLFQPSSYFSIYHNRPYYSGIKVYNNLHSKIKDISRNIKHFKGALRGFLQMHSSYTLNKYFNYKIFSDMLTT